MSSNNKGNNPETTPKQQNIFGKIKDAVLPTVKDEPKIKVKALIQVQMPKQLYRAGDIFEIEDQATLDYLLNSKAVEKL